MVQHSLRESSELIQLIFTNSDIKNGEYLSNILQDNDYVNIQDRFKRTPLHAAAYKNNIYYIQHLLERGARVNTKDIYWLTPLHIAANNGSHEAVKMLLLNGADRFSRDKQWKMPLHLACGNDQLEIVKLLLYEDYESGEEIKNRSINATDKNGRTSLHHAVNRSNIEIVRYLVERGASVNALDKEDRRVLHWASSGNCSEIISYLVENKAEIDCRDKKLFTPLHVAVASGKDQNVKTLLSLGADINALTLQGNTVFHLACLNGYDEILEMLFEALSECIKEDLEIEKILGLVSSTNFLGQTPIHIAASSENGYKCLDLMIKIYNKSKIISLDESVKKSEDTSYLEENLYLDLNTQTTRDGLTPLHLAAYFGRFEAATILIKNGADINSQDYNGSTPLHIACNRGREKFVQFLIGAGACWDSLDHYSSTPLHVAALSGSSQCMGRLLKAASDEFAIDRFSTASSTSNTEDEDVSVTPDGKVLNERPDCGDYLMKRHFKQIVNMTDDKGRNVVHVAVLGLSLECLKIALIHGGDLNLKDVENRTPLHLCAAACVLAPEFSANKISDSNNNVALKRRFEISNAANKPNATNSAFKIAEVLIRLGADVNLADKYGCTPLHFAAAFDHTCNLISLLVENNANLWAIASWPPNSVLSAKKKDSNETYDLDMDELFEQDKTESKNPSENSYFYPIHFAVVTGNYRGVEILVSNVTPDLIFSIIVNTIHVIPNCQKTEESEFYNDHKVTTNVLFVACQKGHLQTLETLINISSHALEVLTTKEEYSELYDHLNQRSIGSITDSLGRTILHIAASCGHLEICRYLLENSIIIGLDICAKDEVFRWNALHHAASQGHVLVVNLLIKWHNNLIILRNPNKEKNEMENEPGSNSNMELTVANNAPMEDFKTNCSEGNKNIQTVTSPFLVDIGDEHLRTPLILAVQNNHIGTIELLLAPRAMGAQDRNQVYANIPVHKWIELRANAVDVYLRSSLHRIVVNGNLDSFNTLLKKGANIHARDFRDRHSLHMIATVGNLSMLSRFIQTIQKIISQITDSDLSISDPYLLEQIHPLDHRGFSPLHYAIFKNNIDCVKYLLSLPEYNTRKRGCNFSILHCASQSGHVECLDESLKSQIARELFYSVDMRSLTSLHLASLNNQLRIVTLLLKYEESMIKMDKDEGHEVSDYLIGRLASICDVNGRTPLMLAAMSGSMNCLEKLLNFHERITILQTMKPSKDHSKDDTSTGSDQESIYKGMISLSKKLNLDAIDENGMTILHHACTNSCDSSGLLILEKLENDAVINQRDHDNRTPAHLAIQSGLPSLLEALIQRGANLYAVDQNGRIPALSSAQNPKIAECLSLCLAAMFPTIQTTQNTSNTLIQSTLSSKSSNWPNFYPLATGVTSPKVLDEAKIRSNLTTRSLSLAKEHISPEILVSSDPESDEAEFF